MTNDEMPSEEDMLWERVQRERIAKDFLSELILIIDTKKQDFHKMGLSKELLNYCGLLVPHSFYREFQSAMHTAHIPLTAFDETYKGVLFCGIKILNSTVDKMTWVFEEEAIRALCYDR